MIAMPPAVGAPPIPAPHLRFVIGDVDYAVAVNAVQSVEALPPLTPLPFSPAWHMGFAVAGDGVLTAVDLGQLLAAPPLGQARYLVVLQRAGAALALPVEAVRGFERIDTAALAGDIGPTGQEGGVAGVWCQGDTPVAVLDVSGLFQLLREGREHQE
ncbi:MAG: chemotaxis protein CheW [Chloroflexi bacterium]|nr:chemotaxis protein CheW [Chloroflexota bacterium]